MEVPSKGSSCPACSASLALAPRMHMMSRSTSALHSRGPVREALAADVTSGAWSSIPRGSQMSGWPSCQPTRPRTLHPANRASCRMIACSFTGHRAHAVTRFLCSRPPRGLLSLAHPTHTTATTTPDQACLNCCASMCCTASWPRIKHQAPQGHYPPVCSNGQQQGLQAGPSHGAEGQLCSHLLGSFGAQQHLRQLAQQLRVGSLLPLCLPCLARRCPCSLQPGGKVSPGMAAGAVWMATDHQTC